MNLGQLRANLRERLDDLGSPPLWTDAFLDNAINEALQEACVRGKLIRVEASITVNIADNEYALDPTVFDVERQARITIAGRDYPIIGTSRQVLDQQDPNWRNRNGRPENFAVVMDTPNDPRVMLSRLPTIAGTLKLGTFVTPAALDDDNDSAPIDTRWQLLALLWAESLAYRKRDADTGSEQLAQKREDQFESVFGPRTTAKISRQQQARHTNTVTANPF